MIPWAHPSPKPKQHLDWLSHFCTDDRRVSLYFTMRRPFPPKKLAPSDGDLDPHLIHGSLGPSESSTPTASRSVQLFLQGSLVWQTDRQTNRQTTDRSTDYATPSVTIGRTYVCSTAMQPNKNKIHLHASYCSFLHFLVNVSSTQFCESALINTCQIWHKVKIHFHVWLKQNSTKYSASTDKSVNSNLSSL